jgi:hypothetical protein
MMAEYPYTLRQVVWVLPITAIFALLPALRQRHGDDSQPTPGDLAACEARKTARDYLTTHFNVTP